MDKEELLEGYFLGKLNTQEQKYFNSLIENDLEFKQEYDFHLNLKRAIQNRERSVLKGKLKGYEEGMRKKVNKKTSLRTLLAMAASFILLISIGWFGYENMFGSNYSALYDDNYSQYPNTVINITRGEGDAETLERKAFIAYESGDLDAAINYFNQLKEGKGLDYLNFYLGQAYLKQDKSEQALIYFKKSIAEEQHFKAESHWYIALAYLKKKDKIQAKLYLEKLIDEYEYMNNEAKALLEELN